MSASRMPKVKARKFDAATLRQAIAGGQWLIETRGGLSHHHSQDYWRFSTKAELRGQVEAGERFVQGIKDALAKKHGEVSIHFLPGPGKWNEELAAKLIADAEQGDTDARQVLREVAAECLERGELPPKPLRDYAATCLRTPPGRKKASQQPNSSKPQSHKTDYRDWILALTVDEIARGFNLNHTRNDATEEHCGCSIVALATKLFEKTLPNAWRSERTVENAWQKYQGIANQRTATSYYVPQVMVLTSDPTRSYLVRFPRVGSIEAMPRPKQRRSRKA